jgi:peptide-methionine (R)-S-oxide reductase
MTLKNKTLDKRTSRTRVMNQLMKNLLVIMTLGILLSCNKNTPTSNTMENNSKVTEKIFKSDEEWKEILTPEQYSILRQKGTERPGTGLYDQHFVKGTYVCAGCGQELFASDSKYDAGCGWPSFSEPSASTVVEEHRDKSYGMIRTEIVCSKCGGHLGHVFNDGPPPTGLRYCINSASLEFKAE